MSGQDCEEVSWDVGPGALWYGQKFQETSYKLKGRLGRLTGGPTICKLDQNSLHSRPPEDTGTGTGPFVGDYCFIDGLLQILILNLHGLEVVTGGPWETGLVMLRLGSVDITDIG